MVLALMGELSPIAADLPRTPRAFGRLALSPRGAAFPLLPVAEGASLPPPPGL